MGRLKDNTANGPAPWMFVARAAAAIFLSLGMAFGSGAVPARAQDTQAQPAPDPGPTQPPESIARMSSVQGKVQVFFSGESGPEQAVMNMPLVEGARLEAGSDGQAEVEFNDGSVARLTPNSSLQLKALTANGVQLEQLSGLGYYELNVGPGHPSYRVDFANDTATPTENTIVRLDLDRLPEVAVLSGSVHVEGAQITPVEIGASQSMRFSGSSGTAPYTITQGIASDSWDQWNSDRDQEIAQEATQQTPVREEAGNAGNADNENWNDLDYYGNWYPVPDYGNVWVPSGVDAGWDPFGSGYWGFYPGFGVTWISGYPWGWLPYHCGGWNYFSFGWGWAPGGCGLGWTPIVRVRGYPGYFLPSRPVFGRRGYPAGGPRLYAVDRGAAARGPWGSGHFVPSANHQAALNVGGRAIAPVGRTSFRSAAFGGTSPGERTALGNSGRVPYQQHAGAVGVPSASGVRVQPRVSPGEAGTRSAYSQRPAPAPHYSAPPAPHYSAPRSAPAGGGHGRR